MKVVNLGLYNLFHPFMKHLFVYGSLLFPKIIENMLGKIHKTTPAVLSGYKRIQVHGCDYPAIITDKNSEIEGKLILNMDSKSLEIITFFEGDDYKLVEVKVLAGNQIQKASVFIWNSDLKLLKMKDWDKRKFERDLLALYLKKIVPETIDEFRKQG